MSRIGKLPVSLPDKVSVELLPGNVLKVKGPLGELSQKIDPDIKVTIEDNEIKFERPTDQPRHRSMHGLSYGSKLSFILALPARLTL